MLEGTSSNLALIGHDTSNAITGDAIVAVGQINPGGQLIMNEFSAIDMGGPPNEVTIFVPASAGLSALDIENGAVINGDVFAGTLPSGVLHLGTPYKWSLEYGYPNWSKQASMPFYAWKAPANDHGYGGQLFTWKALANACDCSGPFYTWPSPAPKYGFASDCFVCNLPAFKQEYKAPFYTWKSPGPTYGWSGPFFAWKEHAFAYGQNGTHANGRVPAFKVDITELARRFESATVYDRFTRYEHYAQSVFRMFWPYGDVWVTTTPRERPEGELAHGASP